jgi:peroxiredoxin
MTSHLIGTREEWLAASAELLEREKELTRMGDELARKRRELPWVPVEKEYPLQTEDGARTLAELFDGRSQLVVYHFMFGPGYEAECPTCSSTADSFNGVLAHLKACDVTMICVSHAPIENLLAYRERMGWSFNWASSHESDFNFDYGVSAEEEMTHDPAVPLLEANELAVLKLLNEQPAGSYRLAAERGPADPARPSSIVLCRCTSTRPSTLLSRCPPRSGTRTTGSRPYGPGSRRWEARS